MNKEYWKDIPGYEGYYQASTLGRVKSLDRTANMRWGAQRTVKGKILTPNKGIWDYYYVSLQMNRQHRKNWRVHRLIALTWIPNPDNLPEVNHIDEDKTNNRVDNLEWVSHIQNMRHGTRNKRVTEKNRAKFAKPVAQYTLDGKLVATYPSIMDAEKQTGIKHNYISACCHHKPHHFTAGGFIWCFVDQNEL